MTGEDTAGAGRPRRLTIERVRELVGEPELLAEEKVTDRITAPFRRFIAHSPFVTIATSGAAGRADCSPRGDYPGFVKVLDDRTLAIPDRVGNGRIDSFQNLARNPGIGLLFLVPGSAETLRVNGSAYLTDDPDVLPMLEAEGKVPQVALIVAVTAAFAHCGRAVLRSRLWRPESQKLADHVPRMGEMLADQVSYLGITAEEVDVEADNANRILY